MFDLHAAHALAPAAPAPPPAAPRAQPGPGARARFGRIASRLCPALRGLAALGVGAALAAGGLLAPQPAAADTTYPVNVTYDSVKFVKIDDGGSDHDGEVYGTVGAYSSAGAASAAGGLPYRIFGRWGPLFSQCPGRDVGVEWDYAADNVDNWYRECPKEVVNAVDYSFSGVWMCKGSQSQTCSTLYASNNNTIPLQVRPGEQFKVTVAMQDYDALSANDNVCVGSLWFGPYTAAELQAKKFVPDSWGKTIHMPDNGSAECWVAFHLS
jgi:hypothetical protein